MLDTIIIIIIIIYFIIIIISCQLAIASKLVDEVVHKAQVVNVIIHDNNSRTGLRMVELHALNYIN
jgi:Tfp pilus assembly major pilin PilA